MQKRSGWTAILALALALTAAIGVHACGGSGSDKRSRERCESCDPAEIDRDCVTECLRFCTASEDCAARCDRECDRCKAELECRVCTTNCTGTIARCAPVGEPLTCDDGEF